MGEGKASFRKGRTSVRHPGKPDHAAAVGHAPESMHEKTSGSSESQKVDIGARSSHPGSIQRSLKVSVQNRLIPL